MSKKIKVIFNPTAGHGRKKENRNRLQSALKQTGLEYSLVETDQPKQATDLAHQAAVEGWSIVAAAGGGGTINEVVNGLLTVDSHQPQLGIIPLGTANDLANSLNIPLELSAACQRLAHGQTQSIDVGAVNQHYFVNNSTIGLESLVTMKQTNLRWLGETTGYLTAALQAILSAKPWEMRIDWLEGMYEGRAVLLSVGNSPRADGLFLVPPQATSTDGLLHLMYGMHMHRWQMLHLLPKILKGEHTNDSKVIYKQTESLKIETQRPTPIQADGEIIDREATQIIYTILPARLDVII